MRKPSFNHSDIFTAMSNLVKSTILPEDNASTRDHINIIFSLRDEKGEGQQAKSKDQQSEEFNNPKRKRGEKHAKVGSVEDQQEDKELGPPTHKKLKLNTKVAKSKGPSNERLGWVGCKNTSTRDVMEYGVSIGGLSPFAHLAPYDEWISDLAYLLNHTADRFTGMTSCYSQSLFHFFSFHFISFRFSILSIYLCFL